jgi:hypothetical protein
VAIHNVNVGLAGVGAATSRCRAGGNDLLKNLQRWPNLSRRHHDRERKTTPSGEKINMPVGEKVILNVTSDTDDESMLILAGPGYELDVKAGTPATREFTIDSPGSFEVEPHHLEKIIVILNARWLRLVRLMLIPLHGIASRRDLRLPFCFVVVGAVLALVISFAILSFAWFKPWFHYIGGHPLPGLTAVLDHPIV